MVANLVVARHVVVDGESKLQRTDAVAFFRSMTAQLFEWGSQTAKRANKRLRVPEFNGRNNS